jgi:hypothetical protein
MLHFEKTTVVKLALLFSLIIGSTNHALALDVTIPVSANDPLIEAAVTEVMNTGEVTNMRNEVRALKIAEQAVGRPMQGEMQPRMEVVMRTKMQALIMPQMQAALSDPTNPDGMWTLFAPPLWM